MPHLVLAAKTLLRQVEEAKPKMKVDYGEPDGLNRIRSLEFDTRTSKWLAPILEACADSRIAALPMSDKNRLTVRFVPTVHADDTTPFQIAEADSVLNESD